MLPTAAHPSPQHLAAFAVGKLVGPGADFVGTHLEGCGQCREFVARTPNDTLIGLLKPTGSPTGDYTPSQAGVATAADTLSVPPELANHPKYQVIRPLGH